LNLPKLNLPSFEAKIIAKGGKNYIYDEIRKKNIVLTPEEWVRQNFIHFLINHHNYSKNYIKIEKQIKVNNRLKRFDGLVYDKNGTPIVLIECKAPEVEISQKTFSQIATYNMTLRVPFLIVTNGITHFICEIDFDNNSYNYLSEIPQI
jgi:hypothetical protein